LRQWEAGLDYEPESRERRDANTPVPAGEQAPEPNRLRRALAEGLQAAS
jgi:hypothetical protein